MGIIVNTVKDIRLNPLQIVDTNMLSNNEVKNICEVTIDNFE